MKWSNVFILDYVSVLNLFCSTNWRVSKDYTVKYKGTHFYSTVTFPITVVLLLGFARGWALWRTRSVESAKSETVFMLIHGETVKIQFFIQVNVKLNCTVTWFGDYWRDCWGGCGYDGPWTRNYFLAVQLSLTGFKNVSNIWNFH